MKMLAADTGIVAFGAYVPLLRLQRSSVAAAHSWFAPNLAALGKGERALANWDEDSVTLAVEAARDALGERDRGDIGSLTFASTSAPFADRQNAGIVKEALNLRDDIAAMDVGGSMRAGTSALLQALRTEPDGAFLQLCVASEKRKSLPASEAELSSADAAAAFVIGRGTPVARLIGSHSVTVDFVDRFRSSDASFDYSWESRWIRDEGYLKLAGSALQRALKKFGVGGESIQHFIAAVPAKGVPEALAKAAGIDPKAICASLSDRVGFAGSAQPLLLLAHVLERAQPGERILLLGFGQGCDILLIETTAAIQNRPASRGVSGWLARRKPETNYLKYLALAGLVQLERGMRAEVDQKQSLAALYRSRRTVLGLVGGRCRKTGVVQFPSSPIGVASADMEAGTLEAYPLAERMATIVTHTADHLTYTPDPPSYYGTVEFDGGGRMTAEFTDVDPAYIQVGARMRMMFRIKALDEQRHFTKYFWKAVPEQDR